MPSIATKNKRIAKNTLFLSIRMLFVLCISLYTTRLLLQILGVSDYGLNNVVCGFVSMFTFLNTAMANGIQRFFNFEIGKGENGNVNNVYNASLLMQMGVAIAMLILVESFGLWYLNYKMVIDPMRQLTANWIFQFSVISFIFVIMQGPFCGAIIAYEKMGYFAIISVVDALLKLGIVILLNYINQDKLLFYGLLLLIISVTNFLLYFSYFKIKFKHFHIIRFAEWPLLRDMLSFSGWNILGAFANLMREQGLNLVINSFFGTIINAARAIAYQIYGALQGFIQNISIAARPQLIQSYAANDQDHSVKLMFSISKINFVLLYIMMLPICFELDYILQIWLGNNIPEHTKTFTEIILLTAIVCNLNTPISMIVHATGKMGTYQIITSIISLLTIPVAYIFLSKGYSPEAVFITSLVFECIKQIASLLILKRLITFSMEKYLTAVVIPIILLTITTIWGAYVITLIMEQGVLRLLSSFFVTTILVTGASFLFIINKEEKVVIKSFVKQKFSKL